MTAYDCYSHRAAGRRLDRHPPVHFGSVQRLVNDGFVEELYQIVRVTKGIA
jgi:hypothetical protein